MSVKTASVSRRPGGRRKNVFREEDFWGSLAKESPDSCWVWQRGRSGGYGTLSFDYGDGTKTTKAHRVAFFLTYGRLPRNKWHVMHLCNNKSCCNPRHLKEGSPSENASSAYRDKLLGCFTKGMSKGIFNPRAKITNEIVQIIRHKRAAGEKLKTLALEYGLSVSGIEHITSRRRWSHVD